MKKFIISTIVSCIVSLPVLAASTAASCDIAGNHLPINIQTSQNTTDLPPLKFSFSNSENKITDIGVLTEVQFSGTGNTILVGSTPYQIVQLHFHSPSKTTINHQHFPIEMHIVALSPNNEEVIFSVPFKLGAENPVINTLWQHLPKGIGNTVSLSGVNLDYQQLLPKNLSYRETEGLTKAPCTKKITWRVLKNYMTMSSTQVAQFRKYSQENNRTVK